MWASEGGGGLKITVASNTIKITLSDLKHKAHKLSLLSVLRIEIGNASTTTTTKEIFTQKLTTFVNALNNIKGQAKKFFFNKL